MKINKMPVSKEFREIGNNFGYNVSECVKISLDEFLKAPQDGNMEHAVHIIINELIFGIVMVIASNAKQKDNPSLYIEKALKGINENF